MKTVRKLTPVSPYDIQGLESWLQDMAREGLYLTKYRNSFCTFTRKAPGAVRYRVEYCKPDRRGPVSPPQALIDLYQDFGWTYVCPAAGASMSIFFTDDPQAEEPHTDPPLQGELVDQMARSQRKSLSWWTAPEEAWDRWTVTEYAVDGLDWCAVAVQPGGGFQLAALSGNGRAVCVQYTGSGSLADHLEEIAGMVA